MRAWPVARPCVTALALLAAVATLGTSRIARAADAVGTDTSLTLPAVRPAGSAAALASDYDAERPWYAEGAAGTIQNGPDGSGLGAGLAVGAHLGVRMSSAVDLALGIEWARARVSDSAAETNITFGGVRARGWAGAGRLRGFAQAGLGLYHFALRQNGTFGFPDEVLTRIGGRIGGGVQYSRSGWWAGVDAAMHGAIGSASLDGGNLLTFTTYTLFVGVPLGR